MKLIPSVAFAIVLSASTQARALGSLAEVSIIDRDSGVELTPYYYRGEYWVAGRPGARYAIEVHNRLGERLLAVTSVDGVNVLSGATAGWDQTGYVFDPGERYQITGWRKSDEEVAAFTFTEAPNSYAERTGRPANVGVIGMALYRERQHPVAIAPPVIGDTTMGSLTRREGLNAPPSAGVPAPPAPSSPPAEPSAEAPALGGSAAASSARESSAERSAAQSALPLARVVPPRPAPSPKLGTGHGEREYSYVTHTTFERSQSQPNEVVRIRYDSLENLLAMGIIKRPRPVPPVPNPFPGSPNPQYVPDPPG
ncbi:MAG TPA: hypothetical protein VK437_11050 [Steroidobacteraceae bacterium]|nr:hypothetical protein [Steroidobacteraceae bacterium]